MRIGKRREMLTFCFSFKKALMLLLHVKKRGQPAISGGIIGRAERPDYGQIMMEKIYICGQ